MVGSMAGFLVAHSDEISAAYSAVLMVASTDRRMVATMVVRKVELKAVVLV